MPYNFFISDIDVVATKMVPDFFGLVVAGSNRGHLRGLRSPTFASGIGGSVEIFSKIPTPILMNIEKNEILHCIEALCNI